jgi:hypothetical protein
MSAFHSPREYVEHPGLLIDELCARGIPLQWVHPLRALDSIEGVKVPMENPLRAAGCIESVRVNLEFRRKRFRAHLFVRTFPVDTIKLSVEEKPSEERVREMLDSNKRVFESMRRLEARIADALAQLGFFPVKSPIAEELEYVVARYQDQTQIVETVHAIRDHQLRLEERVAEQRFEDACYQRDQREALLDNLYDLCIGRVEGGESAQANAPDQP